MSAEDPKGLNLGAFGFGLAVLHLTQILGKSWQEPDRRMHWHLSPAPQ